jgi:hypothetical protein
VIEFLVGWPLPGLQPGRTGAGAVRSSGRTATPRPDTRRLERNSLWCFDADAAKIAGVRQTPMLRVATLLLSVAIATQTVAMAEDAKQDTVEVRGKSLVLSCAEWKHNPDGSWTSTGPLQVGTDVLNGVTLRGAKETSALESKCRNGSSPAVAAPTRDCGQSGHVRRGCRAKESAAGT